MKLKFKEFRLVFLVLTAYLALLLFSPARAGESLKISATYLREMLLILPPVFLLVGLLDVWAPRAVIERNIGPGSGLKGPAIAVLLGSAEAGPLYAAFPIAAMLLKKGARLSNIIIFLTVWAAGKIPMLLMEARFLGLPFAATRLALTLPAAVLIGLLVEKAAGKWPPADLPEKNDLTEDNEEEEKK